MEGPKCPVWILLVMLTCLLNETGSDITSEPEEFGHVIHSVFLKYWMMLLPSESLGSMNSTFSWSSVFYFIFFPCWSLGHELRDSLKRWSTAFLAPGTGFTEDHFSTNWVEWFQDD